MKTIQQTEKELSKKAQDASLVYLKTIEELMNGVKDLKINNILSINTTVFDRHGEKLGKVEHVEWSVSASNNYNMPVGFVLKYSVRLGKKPNGSLLSYHATQVFTKAQILKSMEDKIKKIRKLK